MPGDPDADASKSCPVTGINGRAVAIVSTSGVDVDTIVTRPVGEQFADGGWNCEADNGFGAFVVPDHDLGVAGLLKINGYRRSPA